MVCIVTQVAQITHLVQDNTLCCIAYTEGVKLFHSGKFYTGQKKITQAPPVVPVTDMRYGGEYETENCYFGKVKAAI